MPNGASAPRRDIGHESVPIPTELQGTVRATNDELGKLSLVTEDVAATTQHATVVSKSAAQMSNLFTATLGALLIRTAAFTYGGRTALRGDGPGTDLETRQPRRRRTS